jgi:hypothetical protein
MKGETIMDGFTGNPWHPFMEAIRRRIRAMTKRHRGEKIPGTGKTVDDIFLLNREVRAIVPRGRLTEEMVKILLKYLEFDREEMDRLLEEWKDFDLQLTELLSLREPVNSSPVSPPETTVTRVKPMDLLPGKSAIPRSILVHPPQKRGTYAIDPVGCRAILQRFCKVRGMDWESLSRWVAKRLGEPSSRIILLQLRGTLEGLELRVYDTAMEILAEEKR